MNTKEQISTYDGKKENALGMGGPEKLARRKAMGILNARERIAYLTDEGSFLESGLFCFSSGNPADRESTPADGKIAGYGRINGREAAIIANDFTVKGASSSLTNGKKIGQMKRVATQRGIPAVWLGESSGARMPDTIGARGMGSMLGSDPTQYQRMRETPWATALAPPHGTACSPILTWCAREASSPSPAPGSAPWPSMKTRTRRNWEAGGCIRK